MRKTFLLITLLLFLAIFSGGRILAQEVELSSPGLTPDSPFYFFDGLGEKVGMFFTFGPEKKAEKAIKYAEEKLAETKAMAEKNKAEAGKKANQEYQGFLDLANQKTMEAKEKGKNVEELAILITEQTLKHQDILIDVFEKVPEQAKVAIGRAIEVSKKGSEEAVQAVGGEKKDELLQKIEEAKIKAEAKIRELEEQLIKAEEKIKALEKRLKEIEEPKKEMEAPIKIEEIIPEEKALERGRIPERLDEAVEKVRELEKKLVKIERPEEPIFIFEPKPEPVPEPKPVTGPVTCIREKDRKGITCGGYFYKDYCEYAPDGRQWANIEKCKASQGSDCGSLISTDRIFCPYGCQNDACLTEEKPFINLVSPNGGEILKEGQDYTIQWQSSGLKENEEIRIDISREDGLNGRIATVPASQNSYLWKVETEIEGWAFGYLKKWANKLLASLFSLLKKNNTNQDLSYRYKISLYASKSGISDQSNDYFTVIKQAAPDLTLGEKINLTDEGFAVTICNKGNKDLYQSNKKIEAKIRAGLPAWSNLTFTPVAKILAIMDANLKIEECKQGIVIPYSEFNLQEGIYYELNVQVDPNNEFDELAEGAGRTYHFTVPEPKITLISPNGGEEWYVGNTYPILWESTRLDKVRINLLSQKKDDPSSYKVTNIASEVDAIKGSYSWRIPTEISLSSLTDSPYLSDYPCHKIEVVDARYGRDSIVAKVFSDVSDGCFRIVKACVGEGKTYMPGEAKQCCAGLESMPISVGDGVTCSIPSGYICTAFCGNGKCEGEYENACSCPEDCLAKPMSIAVISPNGGEKWEIEKTYEITWKSTGIDKVLAELYKEGKLFDSLIITSADLGKCSWTVYIKTISELPGDKYRIRVSDYSNPEIYDESDNYFSIVSPTTPAPPPEPVSKPDLTVTDISWTPENPKVGEAITFSSIIRNIGQTDTPSGVYYRVCDYIDNSKTNCNSYGGPLKANESQTITWSKTPNWPSQFSVGSHTFKVVVDDNQVVNESNEANNSLEKTFTVYSQ